MKHDDGHFFFYGIGHSKQMITFMFYNRIAKMGRVGLVFFKKKKKKKHRWDIFNRIIYFDLTSYKLFLKHIFLCLKPTGLRLCTISAECILVFAFSSLSCLVLHSARVRMATSTNGQISNNQRSDFGLKRTEGLFAVS